MRIAILLDGMNPNAAETLRLLSARGVQLDLIYPDRGMLNLADLHVQADLYLIKSGTELSLSMAGSLHALGAATLNPYPTVAMMRNKLIVTRILQQAGVPTPDTFIAADAADLAGLLDGGPLIVKPYHGSRGQGISVVSDPQPLAGYRASGVVLAQRYHRPDGPDHRVFCIGEQLFGVRRRWPLKTYEDKIGQPFTPGPDLCDMANRVSRAFGISLFAMEVIYSQGRPYVVDVNTFGSFLGVPDAPRHLVDYIYTAARRLVAGELPASYALAALDGAVAQASLAAA